MRAPLLRMWIVRKASIGGGLADVVDFYAEDLKASKAPRDGRWMRDYVAQYPGDFYVFHVRMSPVDTMSEAL